MQQVYKADTKILARYGLMGNVSSFVELWPQGKDKNFLVKIGPQRDKTCLRGFQQSNYQICQLSYTDYSKIIESFACSKSRCDCFLRVNKKGANQNAQMCRLVCAFVVHKFTPKKRFSHVKAQLALQFLA